RGHPRSLTAEQAGKQAAAGSAAARRRSRGKLRVLEDCSRDLLRQPAGQSIVADCRAGAGQADLSEVRAVCVAADQVYELLVEKPLGGGAGGLAEPACDGGGRQLDERPAADQLGNQLEVLLDFGVAFRVADDRSDAGASQVGDDLGESERPADIRRLEQQVVGIPAETEAMQVVGAEAVELLERQLPARK